jgi:hypothetical protein
VLMPTLWQEPPTFTAGDTAGSPDDAR